MFDAIRPPPNEFAGPSTGHSTENGDSWFNAVRKINAGFKSIVDRLENGVSDIVGKADKDARDRVSELEDHITKLEERVTALEERFSPAAMVAPTDEEIAEIKASGPGDEIIAPEPEPEPELKPEAPKPMRATGVARAAKIPANPEFGGGTSK